MSGAELCERQFQSTPPARGRLEKILLRLKKTAISIHAPREGGRLPSEYPGSGANDISIHAPARGGDAAYQLKIDALEISIHAPARGGDTSAADRSFTSRNFNPRPREGGRPPWRSSGPSRAHNFNPRPREGGRPIHSPMSVQWSGFQSTPPRGGATVLRGARRTHIAISIHAPARGGDHKGGIFAVLELISIHAPARGGDAQTQTLASFQDISIHAPARGGDSKDAQFYLRIFDKQVELLRFWGKMRGGCLRNPEKDRRFLGKSLANLPEISGHLDFAGA